MRAELPNPIIVTIYLLVLASGITGLTYQVVWQKYLAVFLGSHSAATALVLGGFFFYLAMGYLTIGHWISRLAVSRLHVYAILELGIGAFAIVSPDLFTWLRDWYWQSTRLATPVLSELIITSACIGLPTFLMGGTIPALTEGLSRSFGESHVVHARVYGLNTLGAFLGTTVTTFYLLENFSLPQILLAAGAANVGIFLVSWILGKMTPESYLGPKPDRMANDATSAERVVLLSVSAISGFYVFSLENLIVRMVGVTLGSTVYSYGIVVAAFILAIAIGSYFAGRIDTHGQSRRLVAIQGALFLATMGLYLSMPEWPDFFLRVRLLIYPAAMNFDWYLLIVMALIILILMTPVALMGMSLPMLFGHLRSRQINLSRLVGDLYAVNCIGAALGALIGGYLLFSWLNTAQIFRFNLALIALATGLVMFLDSRTKRMVWVPILAIASLSRVPDWPLNRLYPGRNLVSHPAIQSAETSARRYIARESYPQMDFLFHRDDPDTSASVVTMTRRDPASGSVNQTRSLLLNGKPESIYPDDASVRTILPLFTAFLSADPRRATIVGLGAGRSASVLAAQSTITSVQVLEISAGVIDALPHFSAYNPDLEKNRDKITIRHGDAFRILRQDTEKSDIILSEPTNLWVTGVDKLYSAEFFQLVRDRLSAQGIFGLWVPASAINADTFRMILGTLNAVFPHIRIFNAGQGVLSILSSLEPLELPDSDRLQQLINESRPYLESLRLSSSLALFGLEIFPPWTVRGLAEHAPGFHSLEFPNLTFKAARTTFGGPRLDLDEYLQRLLIRPVPTNEPSAQYLLDSNQQPSEVVTDILNFYLERGNLTSRLAGYRWLVRASQLKIPIAKDQQRPLSWLLAALNLQPAPKLPDASAPWLRTRYLLQGYQQARLAHLQPSAAAVLESVDLSCRSIPCALLARDLLEEFRDQKSPPGKKVSDAELSDPATRSGIFSALEELVRSIRRGTP